MIATAIAFDDQMRSKIEKHRQERGNHFKTIEEPINIAESLLNAQTDSAIILVDCVTMWLNNLLHYFSSDLGKIESQLNKFIRAVAYSKTSIIIVTNEIGLGVMPDNALARRYADELGYLNQRLVAISDDVIFLVSGIPQSIKNLPNRRQEANGNEQMDREVKTYSGAGRGLA